MLGFISSIYNLLLGIFDTIDTYRSIAFAYINHFVHGVLIAANFVRDFNSFVPAPLQVLGATLICITIARLCISLGGH